MFLLMLFTGGSGVCLRGEGGQTLPPQSEKRTERTLLEGFLIILFNNIKINVFENLVQEILRAKL